MHDPVSNEPLQALDLNVFESMPGTSVLLETVSSQFNVLAVTREFLFNTGKKKEEVIGSVIFKLFLASKAYEKKLRTSFEDVIKTGTENSLIIDEDKLFESGRPKYRRSITNSPIINSEGRVQYILHTINNPGTEVMTQSQEKISRIEQSESTLREITDTVPAIIWITNPDGYCTYLNKHWYEFTGQTEEEAEGFGWLNATHPDDMEQTGRIFLESNQNRKPFFTVYRLRNKVGEYRWAIDRANPKFDKEGNYEGMVGTVMDVHDQKLAELEREKLISIIEASHEFIGLASLDTSVVYLNPSAMKMLGWESVDGRKIIDSIYPEDRDFAQKVVPELLQDGSFRHEVRAWNEKNGEPFWLQWNGFLIRDKNLGDTVGFATVSPNINDRKLSENALKESEQRFQAAIDAIQGILWTNNAHGRMEGLQPGWAKLTGQSYEEYQGYGWADAVHPEDAQPTIDEWNRAVKDRRTFVFEHRVKMKSGDWGLFSIRAIPLINNDGSLREWVGVHTNITERKNAENAVRESEERFRTMAEGTEILIAISDETNNLTYFNKAWVDLTGRKMEDLLNFGWADLVHPDDRTGFLELYLNSSQKRQPFSGEFRILNKNGEYRWLLAKVPPRFRPDQTFAGYISSSIDITERKQAEEALKESVEKFKNVLESVPQMTWTALPTGELNFYNQKWYSYTGLSFEESKDSGWKLVIHPNDLPYTLKTFTDALKTGKTFQVENRHRRHDGEFRWHLNRALPVRGESGEIILWVGTSTDIHEQKATEEELEKIVNERTMELQRSNEDLQQFAHVASHDLREPIRKIKIYADRLETEAENLDQKAKLYLKKVQGASDRMFSMIDSVLSYSTINATEQNPGTIDLRQILNNIETDLEVVIQNKNAEIRYHHIPEFQGTALLIYQLFYNLINNSLKFARKETAPVISITADTIQIRDNTYVRIVVNDNGIGFKQEYAAKIFDTFLRLNVKDDYEGTGLGLSLCKKIVERHNGFIEANGNLGIGSSFIITLPAKQSSSSP